MVNRTALSQTSKPMENIWCWIDETPRSGRENMDIDWALAKQAEAAPEPITRIRFYRWDRPTVSLGKHQNASTAVDLERCREREIPIVHRPTGGRAVLHADELTYAVVSNDATRFPLKSVTQTYLVVAQALQLGLRSLRVETEIASGAARERSNGRSPAPCFVSVSRHELVHGGRKLVGSAQRRLRRSFLQHGSLPLTIDYPLTARLLKTDPEILQETMVGLSEALSNHIAFIQVAESLQAGFEKALGVRGRPSLFA